MFRIISLDWTPALSVKKWNVLKQRRYIKTWFEIPTEQMSVRLQALNKNSRRVAAFPTHTSFVLLDKQSVKWADSCFVSGFGLN